MGNAEGSNGKSNDELVDNLVKNEVVKKKEIELVMRLVDRGRFVPDAQRRAAYRDVAWKSETGGPGFLHLSAPCIYASVLENLKVEKGMSFLNIGSGTGYLSTMVGFLLGESGVNHGFELYENVLDFSLTCVEKTLMSPEVSAFEWCKPLFFNGNAFQVKTEMRYDRIYCGALVPHSRRSYFCNFLKVGGILVVPYGHLLQRIVRQSETQFVVYDVSSVVFSQLVFPNQENGFTMRQLEIPLLKAPRLTDICRNKIRHCIREAVNSSGIYPLQMRYQCLKPVEQRSDESGSTSTELDPFRQPPARRNRIPLWIVGRANMLLFDREAPIDELDEEVGPQGDFEQRPEPNANPRHFLAMIGERIARHQRARARNAAAEPNLFPEDLIMAQEEEQRDVHPAAEVTPLGEQKMLDDRYFELNMGFRFKRGRTEEDNEEIFENLRFVPRDRINIVDVMNVDGNMDLAHGLDMDLAHDEPQNNVAFDDVADRDQRNQEQGLANQEEAEVVHAIIVDDEELEDGVGHALDDPLDEEDVHVLDESFAADSDATYEIVDESLEEQQEIEADADIRSESGGSDDQSSSSDDEVNSERGDDGANISEDDLQRRLGQNDHLDDDEHDADQTEGARLQALHLANFHEEFLSRLDALPLSSTMLAYVKSREAAFNNQSSDNASSSADDMESRLGENHPKNEEVVSKNLGGENQ